MQFSIFDGIQKFLNNKPIRLIELFGGISAQATALHELGVEFEHYRYVDFDKYAVKSTNAMYGTDFEPTDITKINASDLGVVETDKYTYIMTYSFPCQDLSSAGKGAGMVKGSGTRSSLLWEVERLLNEMTELPQVLLMENVPQVHGKKNIDSFNEWIKFLERKGYKNYWQDLKATDFGIPQSRKRTFMISLLGDYYYTFPKEIKLEYLLKDFLESEVDEKYYLSDKVISGIINTTFNSSKIVKQNLKQELADKLIKSGRVKEYDIIRHNYSSSRMEDKRELSESNNISPTLDTRCDCLGVVEPNKTYFWNYGESKRFQKLPLENMARTLKAKTHDAGIIQNLRIRKLTPRECWRLMGFRDELFDKAQAVNSNFQLYKQAGNSIVTTVLMAIFGELLDIEWQSKVKNLINDIKE